MVSWLVVITNKEIKAKCFFAQNSFKYKNNSQLLLKKFPHKS